MTSAFRIHSRGLTVAVRLTPGARSAGCQGIMDSGDGKESLKISVNAVAEGGKANKELLSFLSKSWKIQKRALTIIAGETSRQKVLLLEGDGAALLVKLTGWLSEL